MIMKYKDFKMLSVDDMKKVMGGDPPVDWCQVICGGGSGVAWQCDVPPAGHSYFYCYPPSQVPGPEENCFIRAYCNLS